MLKVDPAERYQTATEALAAFKRFTAPASIARSAVKWIGFTGIGILVLTALGAANTAAFNVILGRSSEFDPDQSFVTWFRWGVGSMFPRAFYSGIWAIILTLLVGVVRLLRTFVPPINTGINRGRLWLVNRLSERGLDDPALVFQSILAVATAVLIALVLVYWDYGGGLLTSSHFVNEVSADRLVAMQPANEYRLDTYGRLIDLWLLLFGIATFRTLSWARRVNAGITRTMKALAITLPMVAAVLWQYPYRVVYQSAFERVDFENVRCYALGNNGSSALLHCPDIEPPRNRTVSVRDPRLHRRGVTESMFLPAHLSQPTR
jgi:hypothetical protein